ncbi:MAG: hypothetical protein H0T73_15385 [Ardenticatenales bacterium]|nr:hypothetical protein [Ardenticatenales bacterium]
MAYWSVTRGALLGHGYYDMTWLKETQQSLGYDRTYVSGHYYPVWLLWNPAPLLLPLMPLAALTFTESTLAWLSISMLLYVHATLLFTRILKQSILFPFVAAVVVAILFLPFFAALAWGQPTLLLGAFLIYAWQAQRRGQQVAAGILLIPLLLKPHLLFIVLGLIGVVAIRNQQWRLIGTGIGGVLALGVVAFLLDPHWLPNWLAQGAPIAWETTALSDMIRVHLDLPPIARFYGVGLGLLLAGWRYRGVTDISPHTLAEATLLSSLCAPYLWYHDTVVLLPVVIWIAAISWTWPLASLLLLQMALNAWLFYSEYIGAMDSSRYLLYLVLLLGWWFYSQGNSLLRRGSAPVG